MFLERKRRTNFNERGLSNGGGTMRGDAYRIRAAEMTIKAERNERYRKEFENLVLVYLRLAEQADRIEQMSEQVAPQQRRPKEEEA
jgi:hypothetical protein